jgi:hypothetical protein
MKYVKCIPFQQYLFQTWVSKLAKNNGKFVLRYLNIFQKINGIYSISIIYYGNTIILSKWATSKVCGNDSSLHK